MGWKVPILISNSYSELASSAHRTDGVQNVNNNIYKVPINGSEYFLVETRYFDPGKNGQHLKVYKNGAIKDVYFPRIQPDLISMVIYL